MLANMEVENGLLGIKNSSDDSYVNHILKRIEMTRKRMCFVTSDTTSNIDISQWFSWNNYISVGLEKKYTCFRLIPQDPKKTKAYEVHPRPNDDQNMSPEKLDDRQTELTSASEVHMTGTNIISIYEAITANLKRIETDDDVNDEEAYLDDDEDMDIEGYEMQDDDEKMFVMPGNATGGCDGLLDMDSIVGGEGLKALREGKELPPHKYKD